MSRQQRELNFLIDCYLRFVDDMVSERVEFVRTGAYSCSSFEDVNRRVYDNPEVMSYHMHGLFLSQFLWHQHVKMYRHFVNAAGRYAPHTQRYLEVGAGHGFYLGVSGLHRGRCAGRWSMSARTSLELCRHMAGRDGVRFIQADICSLPASGPGYDFITMGEVLEDVEDPGALLRQLRSLCRPGGVIFISTPTNAPTIDHIYLFREVQEIRDLIEGAGLTILEEYEIPTETPKARKNMDVKIAILYGALLTPNESRSHE